MRIKKVNGKKIWSFVIAMAMVIGILPQMTMPVQAAGEVQPVYGVMKNDGFVYATNSDNTKIDGAKISKKTITNLFVADGVKEIVEAAFGGCTSLTTVTMPNVTTINDAAFSRCESLITVEMPNATKIGEGAFGYCKALTTIQMTKVTEIMCGAFSSCTHLTNITLGANPPTVGPSAFIDCPADRILTIDGGTSAAVKTYKDDVGYSDYYKKWYGWTLPAPIVSYGFWVGGVLVTSANANNITGDGIEGKVTYDAGTSTLTLDNATIEGYHTGENYSAGIYGNSALKIALEGENKIDFSGASVSYGSYGIFIKLGELELSGTVGGSDSLTVTSGKASWESSAICAYDITTITDCTVEAIGGAANGEHARSFGLLINNVVINNSTVTAIGGNASFGSFGIGTSLGMTITNSTVKATGGAATGTNSGSYGIAGQLTSITNSTVTAIGNSRALSSPYSGDAIASYNVNGKDPAPEKYNPNNNYSYKWFQSGSGAVSTTHTVSFIGGDGATGIAPTQADTAENGKFILPSQNTLAKTGYTFAGWNDGTKTYQPTESYTMPAKAVTFTAQWTKDGTPPATKTYTVTYNANGGTGTILPQTTDVGTTTTLTTNTFTRTGYTFKEWNTKADGKGTSYTNSLPTQPAGTTVTLYAQWTKDGTPATKTYTVTYNANGGSGTILPQVTNVGTTTTIATNTFQRTGHTFAGWNTLANGKGNSYTNSLPSQTAGTTVTLYAQWTEITYEVTGTVTDDKDVVVSGATVMLMKGNKQTGETATTGSDGKFAIVNVPNGTYNLVVSKGDITVTTIIVISSADKATGTIKLPSGKTNSIVDVKPNTPQIVVGNLENQFADADKDIATNGGSVEIKLTAEGKTASTAPKASDILATASSNGKTVGQFIDLSVLKTVTPNAGVATATPLKELQDLVEIFIPLDTALQGKSEYVIYRYHGTGVDTITTVANADGEMIALVDNNTTIKLTVKKFSTYAIAYKNTPTGGGGSTGGGSTGGTTGGEPEKPEIVKPVPPVEKPIPPVVKPKPPIVKPLPPKKPAKSPQTGDNTPLEFPITLGTLGLALMALGLYLKRKQQSAE